MATFDHLFVTPEVGVTGQQILTEIYDLIRKNSIQTWAVDIKDNNSLYHTADSDQWAQMARLVPSIKPATKDDVEKLLFKVKVISRSKPEEHVRGIYLGRFSHVLVAHLESKIKRITIL